ncbi:MAG: hypothetical protein HKO96_10525 [Flavobacteriaceae bacterium]|nr:hypothetical protein [Bacteroidia bacterium]NNK70900.1 hypothetical protein [Flavobacteriaceae bacterium]
MTGQVKFKVLPDIKLTLIYYEGMINLPMVKRHLFKMGSHKDYDPSYDAITDFGHSVMEVTTEEIKEAAEFVKNSKPLLGKRKQAFIFRTAEQQVISSLFSMLSGDLPVTFNVVSTLREAKIYVGVKTEHYNKVQQVFSELSSGK